MQVLTIRGEGKLKDPITWLKTHHNQLNNDPVNTIKRKGFIWFLNITNEKYASSTELMKM